MKYGTIVLLVLLLILQSCQEPPSPKPIGYYRIDFPQKEYIEYKGDCPFSFDYPKRSILDDKPRGARNCWMNLHYPQYAATIHLTYIPIDVATLPELIEDSRRMAMKHIIRADDIQERFYSDSEKGVYGLSYDFEGSTATNYQFFLTDSSNHFVRGSMYFNLPPNPDSLAPVAQFIKKDLVHFIESFNWEKPQP